jgi:hypothetical protein
VSWGAHSGIAEDLVILGCYSVSTDELPRTFRWEVGAFEPSDVANDLTVHIQEHTTLPLTNVSITLFSKSVPSHNVTALCLVYDAYVNGSTLIHTSLDLRLHALRPLAEIASLLNFRSPIFGLTVFGWVYYITLTPYFCWEYHIDVFLHRLLQLLLEPQLGRKTRPTCILNNQSQEEERGRSSNMTIRLG